MALLPVFDIARSALLANEAALDVTGNNIANVNTPGYSRRRVDLVEERPVGASAGLLVGRGVRVESVSQIVDPLLERRRQSIQTALGQETALRDQLESLGGVVNDLQDPSLATVLNGFFDAADGLARNPSGLAEREAFLGRARALASEVNRRRDALGALQRSADDRYVAVAGEANAALEQIADLNRHIVATEQAGQTAATLRDQRQVAVTTLAHALAISVVDHGDGSISVAAANGVVLVAQGNVLHPIATRATTPGLDGLALHEAGILTSSGQFVSVPDAFASGELAGLAEARDEHVATTASRLDLFAATLAGAVNAYQQDPAAFDLDGAATTTAPIFSGSTAADIAVALTDPRRIAAGLSDEPGDGQNALRLAALRTTTQTALGGVTFASALAAELARVGEAGASAGDAAAATDLLAENLEAQREAISGVNLNEELTSLLRYQHAFQAAARVISVADSLLDDLVHLV